MDNENVVSLNVARLRTKGKQVIGELIGMLNNTGDLLCDVAQASLIEFQEKVNSDLHWRLICKLVADPNHFAQRNMIFSSLVQRQVGDAEGPVPYAWIRFDETDEKHQHSTDHFTKPYELLIAIPYEYWPEMGLDLLIPVIGGANRLYAEGFRIHSWESSVPDRPESKTLITLVRGQMLATIEVDFKVLLADANALDAL